MFYFIFILLESVTFFYDPWLRKKTGFSYKSVLFINQGVVFSLAAFLPVAGFPFFDIRKGNVLVDGEIMWVSLLLGVMFFCLGIMYAKNGSDE